MDEYQHLRESADADRVLADLDALGIGFGLAPASLAGERHWGIPRTGQAGSDARWADADRHSKARAGGRSIRRYWLCDECGMPDGPNARWPHLTDEGNDPRRRASARERDMGIPIGSVR